MTSGNPTGSWIACAPEALQGSFATIVRACWPFVCGQDELASAWLEDDPLYADGLRLRDAALGADDANGGLSLDQAQALPKRWPEGRIFGSQGELRWECRSADTMDLVLTTDRPAEGALPDGFDHKLDLDALGEEALLLWGNNEKGSWSEERIPQLPYPSQWQGPYATILSRSYLHIGCEDRLYESRIVRYRGYNGAYQPKMETV